MWCTLAICAIWTHLDPFGDIHAIDWNSRCHWIPYFRLQLRFCVSSRTKPHPGARRLGITGKMLLRGCTVQVWWRVGYAGCGCGGRFQVPKDTNMMQNAKRPGHEALNAWRDIAEVLECACQQLGQNYSGLMESHLVTKTHSCMRWSWWMISSFLTTRTVDVYLSAKLTMVCGVCSMSRPPDLQLFRNSRHFEHLQDGGHKAGDAFCNTCTSKKSRASFFLGRVLYVASTFFRFSCIFVIRWLQSQSFSQLSCSSSRAAWKWSCSTL